MSKLTRFQESRRAWALQNNWEFTATRYIEPDLFGVLNWRQVSERDKPVVVESEVRGKYGDREAFAHVRPLPLNQAEVRAQIRHAAISGVESKTDLPVSYIFLSRSNFSSKIYPMPWTEGLTCYRQPYNTPTAVWVQPGYEELTLNALASLLQNTRQIVEAGNNQDYIIATGGRLVLVGEGNDVKPDSILFRMGLATDVATRLEYALQQ